MRALGIIAGATLWVLLAFAGGSVWVAIEHPCIREAPERSIIQTDYGKFPIIAHACLERK